MYGDTDSALHRGIGTDRFVALWLLDSDRVAERLGRALGAEVDGTAGPPGVEDPTDAPAALTAVGPPGAPRPGVRRLGLDHARVRVSIPADIGAMMERDPALAAAWRAATREVFTHYLERGYQVVDLDRADGAAPAYVLSPTATHPSDREDHP
jgi:predicted GNAT superfamily acetyltransferase